MELGQSPSTFWDLSFREYQLAIEGLGAARRRALSDALSLAWHTASLTTYAYHQPKKMPPLEALVHPDKPASRGQSADQQIAILKSILAKKKR